VVEGREVLVVVGRVLEVEVEVEPALVVLVVVG
jgi:hypothetical protein